MRAERRATVRWVASALLLGGAAVVAACGDDSASPGTTAAAGPTVTIELSDYAFGNVPAEVTSSTRFLVENVSDTELHELVAFRLDAGDERPLDEIIGGDLGAELGSQMPLMVILAPPGGEQVDVIGRGTLPPGRYLLLCVIPTGADPAEYLAAAADSEGPPEVDGGPPHLVHGMYSEITVTDA